MMLLPLSLLLLLFAAAAAAVVAAAALTTHHYVCCTDNHAIRTIIPTPPPTNPLFQFLRCDGLRSGAVVTLFLVGSVRGIVVDNSRITTTGSLRHAGLREGGEPVGLAADLGLERAYDSNRAALAAMRGFVSSHVC